MSTVDEDEEVVDDSCTKHEAMKEMNINEYLILSFSSEMTFIDFDSLKLSTLYSFLSFLPRSMFEQS